MYKSDFLEILWLLKREVIHDRRINRALELLQSRRLPDGTWKIERRQGKLIVPFSPQKYANVLVTGRGLEVLGVL
ncbi:MAG: hypothetical protein PQJ46_07320 [Spirochaetales bacterium]|nr:hypothetical protein [Spirochaetales bacterium]